MHGFPIVSWHVRRDYIFGLILLIVVYTGMIGYSPIGERSITANKAAGELAQESVSLRCHGESGFERDCAVRAAASVRRFYQGIGFPVHDEPQLTILFMDTLTDGMKQIDWALGVYCREGNRILMSHFNCNTLWQNDRYAGLDRGEVYYSILAHEIAHRWNALISPGLLPSVDEAIAGFVQYSLMDAELRESLTTGAAGFHSYREMVMSRYINDPDDFLASAYLYLREHPSLLKRWLEGRGPFPKDPFFL